jgi:hypothetical protein
MSIKAGCFHFQPTWSQVWILTVEVFTGLALAQGWEAQILFGFGLGWVTQITFGFGYSRVAQILGFSLVSNFIRRYIEYKQLSIIWGRINHGFLTHAPPSLTTTFCKEFEHACERRLVFRFLFCGSSMLGGGVTSDKCVPVTNWCYVGFIIILEKMKRAQLRNKKHQHTI